MWPFVIRESPHHFQERMGVSFHRTIPRHTRCPQNCFDVAAGCRAHAKDRISNPALVMHASEHQSRGVRSFIDGSDLRSVPSLCLPKDLGESIPGWQRATRNSRRQSSGLPLPMAESNEKAIKSGAGRKNRLSLYFARLLHHYRRRMSRISDVIITCFYGRLQSLLSGAPRRVGEDEGGRAQATQRPA